jgi:shikimate kinase
MSIKLDKTVVLVGLMGAGKTTVGSRLAKNLNVEFADSDQEISEAAGCSVSDIFAIHGEEIFRDLELRVMTRLLNNPPHVLATGGGAFINPKIRKLIKENAISICLRRM